MAEKPGFLSKAKNTVDRRPKSFHQANKEKIDAIRSQVKAGKLTKQQAYEQIAALFAAQHKGNFHGRYFIFKELKTAVHKNDKAGIQSALKKLDEHLKTSNQQLAKNLSTQR
ncbi:hypothetical protein QS257_13695 [Terrilactibacillus sp. S3-3]|nr:hypothetical protein QS257_13695 [Terrilactibacillus sp. S3-3]